jgi:pyruvate dehydrogenase E2 component (dihydrolipoamide acetyltransferase)
MTDITMPRLSDSMEEGTILSWLKEPGDHVNQGDELVEIETDKATMTYESPDTGVLADRAADGTTHAVGAVIASFTDVAAPSSDVAQDAPLAVALNSPPVAAAVKPASSNGAHTTGWGDAVRATPLARRIAAAHGVELGDVTGTGPRGRIKRSDVAAAARLPGPSPSPPPPNIEADPPNAGSLPPATPAPSPRPDAGAALPRPDNAKGATTTRELTRVQQVIARRMAEAKATVPHFQVQTEVALDAVLLIRAQLKVASDRPPSLNDFIIKASALALREFPLANGSYREGQFELHERVNVGVAVAAADALVVPTVVDADQRSLGSIAGEVRRLAAAVRDGTVTPAELAGATFTVSNLGMYGMTAITPVLNTPQAAILGVGAARPVLARVDGEIVDRRLMTLTLSCDHRILYGAQAAQFLSRIRTLLEEPLLLAF